MSGKRGLAGSLVSTSKSQSPKREAFLDWDQIRVFRGWIDRTSGRGKSRDKFGERVRMGNVSDDDLRLFNCKYTEVEWTTSCGGVSEGRSLEE
jgi:hypothetical protein